jgi:hypothetical protein
MKTGPEVVMTKLRCCGWLLAELAASCVVLSCFAHGQALYQDQEIQVHDLPSLMASSPHSSDVLLTSLDTIFHDHETCCGKDSALEDSAQSADPKSLKDIAGKLDGRHLLGDGRPIKVTATYVAPEAVNSGMLIAWFQNQHAALMMWNSHLYVVHGIVYIWTANYTPEGSGPAGTVIKKFLLWDTRFSDSRRNVVFDRETDDLAKVQGFLFVEAKPQ